MKGHDIADIIMSLQQHTTTLEEQLPILIDLTTCDVDKTGMVMLYCKLADIYYELERFEEFVECCEDAKDNMSIFVTHGGTLAWYKRTLLKQAEYHTYNQERFDLTLSTLKSIISMLQMHEAEYSEFFDVQERLITLLDWYREVEVVRYKATWSNMSDSDRKSIAPKYLDDVNEQRRKDFLSQLEQGRIGTT